MYTQTIYANLAWTQEGADESFNIPMIGGTGNIVDPTDPSSFEVDPAFLETLFLLEPF